MSQDVPEGTDPLLIPLIRANSEVEAGKCLENLLIQHAEPIIRRVIRTMVYRSAGGAPYSHNAQDAQEADDLASQVQVQLVAKLRALMCDRDAKPIGSFSGYVAGMSHNVCNSYLRRKWPERYRLKTRAQYVLSHDQRFAIWEDGNAKWVCGLAEWKEQGARRMSRGRVTDLLSNRDALPAVPAGKRGHDMAGLMKSILQQAGAPIEVDDIVTVAAGVLGITDRGPRYRANASQPPETESGGGAESHPHLAADALGAAEQRLRIERMLSEIEKLPRPQKVALLLGLKDERGDSLLMLLSDERVITVRRIAAMLEMDLKQIAAVWSDLPLDDASIANMLGLAVRQVGNLRLAARRRLGRRVQL